MQGLAHEGRARRALVLPLSCAAAETFKIRAEPFYGDSRGNFPRGSLRLRHRAFPAGVESFGFLKNGFGNRVFSSLLGESQICMFGGTALILGGVALIQV